MDRFGYNELYLTKNDKPWLPVMGEFHFSRYPKKYWKESLEKMKAGGVSIVATYIIWIHHEEIQGEIDWTGDNDLHTFVQLCKELGLYVFLRPGPWVHGEVRNGGFPDWLQHGPYKLRTNDPAYLAELRRFWTSMYEQVKEFLVPQDDTVVGIQIENEYGEVGGEGGDDHIRKLTAMAREIGYDAPYWTATGWGAYVGDLLPVQGGYCEAPWDRSLEELPPNMGYTFIRDIRRERIHYEPEKFPLLLAELGGGLQVTYNRRPAAHSHDTGAMSMVKLGSGANLMGYYVYHGGTNPKGKLSSFQESKDTGSWCDLPELTYDFRAPIREYGQISNTYKEIRMLALFLSDWGEELAPMKAYMPAESPDDPANLTDLRTCYREKDGSGYIFVNNYQRRYPMAEHKAVVLKAGEIEFPAIDIQDKDYYFFPYNMQLGDSKLVSAVATPLCKINDGYVFYGDRDPKYQWEGEPAQVLTLSREQARNAARVELDKQYLIISEQPVIQTEDGVYCLARKTIEMQSWPALPELAGEAAGELTGYTVELPETQLKVNYTLRQKTYLYQEYDLEIIGEQNGDDIFLRVDYEGNQAELMIDGVKVADDYFRNDVWEIGLKKWDFPRKLTLRIFALEEGAPVFLDEPLEMVDHRAMRLKGITVEEETKVKVL